MLKIVIDTNVFISGILTDESNPSIVIKAWKRSHKYQLFITEEIIREVLRVMKRLNISDNIVKDWDRVIRVNAIKISPNQEIKTIKEDPCDNKFLECAKKSQADYIVSGDKHLIKLSKFEKTQIVNAKEFIEILRTYKES